MEEGGGGTVNFLIFNAQSTLNSSKPKRQFDSLFVAHTTIRVRIGLFPDLEEDGLGTVFIDA